MSNAKPMNTPMHDFVPLAKDLNGKKVYKTIYRGMIKSLLYLIANRPTLIVSSMSGRDKFELKCHNPWLSIHHANNYTNVLKP